MNKFVKKMVFMSILFLSIAGIIANLKFTIKDEVYVVSEAEENKKIDNDKNENTSSDIDKLTKEKDELEKNLQNDAMVTIFVSGEVKTPGVVTLEINKRLSDAINELGGFTQDADLNKINLAMKIEDEKHYIIPKIGENIELTIEDENSGDVQLKEVNNNSSLININTANIKQLDALPGVGEATANKIINYREENGEFKMIEEIKNVNGIGDKKYEEIKELISVE